MSFKAVLQVLEHSESDGRARLVMIALAEHANDQDCAYPSVATMARHGHMSTRSVQRALRDLEEMGEIVHVGESKYGTKVYQMTLDLRGDSLTGDSLTGGDSTAQIGDRTGSEGATPLSPEPTTKPTTKPPGAGAQGALLPTPLEEVWAHYQAVIPNGSRYQLDSPRKTCITRALKVRTVDECKRAITALSHSAHHLGRNDGSIAYLDIKYALGKPGSSPDSVIDGWLAKATAPDGKPKSTVQQMFDALPQAEKAEIGLKIQQAKARFVRPQHQPTVRAAREAEAELRRYPGIEIIETGDGAFSGWRLVGEQI